MIKTMKYITRTELFGAVLSEVNTKKNSRVFFNHLGERTDKIVVLSSSDAKSVLNKVRIK